MSQWTLNEVGNLPEGARGGKAVGWWGMVLFIATETMLFAGLFFAYFYIRNFSPHWPPPGIKPPEIQVSGIMTGLLVVSSLPMFIAQWGIGHGRQCVLRGGLAATFVLGSAFLAMQFGIVYPSQHFMNFTNAYGSLFYTITGIHALHVLGGLLMNATTQLRAWLGHFTSEQHLAVENMAIYWHFVNVIAVAVYISLNVFPHFSAS